MKILLVDDQPDCAYALSRLLMLAGHDVLIANSGREGAKVGGRTSSKSYFDRLLASRYAR